MLENQELEVRVGSRWPELGAFRRRGHRCRSSSVLFSLMYSCVSDGLKIKPREGNQQQVYMLRSELPFPLTFTLVGMY